VAGLSDAAPRVAAGDADGAVIPTAAPIPQIEIILGPTPQ